MTEFNIHTKGYNYRTLHLVDIESKTKLKKITYSGESIFTRLLTHLISREKLFFSKQKHFLSYVSKLENLKELDLNFVCRDCSNYTIPESVIQENYLNIINNHKTKIFVSLIKLTITGFVPRNLSYALVIYFRNLRELSIPGLHEPFNELVRLTNLESLTISDNTLIDYVNGLETLTQISELNIGGLKHEQIHLLKFPPNIVKLHLEYLKKDETGEGKITIELKKITSQLKRLEFLILSNVVERFDHKLDDKYFERLNSQELYFNNDDNRRIHVKYSKYLGISIKSWYSRYRQDVKEQIYRSLLKTDDTYTKLTTLTKYFEKMENNLFMLHQSEELTDAVLELNTTISILKGNSPTIPIYQLKMSLLYVYLKQWNNVYLLCNSAHDLMSDTLHFDSIIQLVNEIRKEASNIKNSTTILTTKKPTTEEFRKIVSTLSKIDFFLVKGFKKDT